MGNEANQIKIKILIRQLLEKRKTKLTGILNFGKTAFCALAEKE